jgi:predicted lipoprotein
MLKRIFKYFVGIVFLGIVIYNSIYIKKLSDNQASAEKAFDAKSYAREYLFEKIPASKAKAIPVFKLLSDLKSNSNNAFKNYSNTQNTGDLKYFFVQGEGEIVKIEEDYVTLKSKDDASEIKISTQFIFGNAARDGSGLISINDFNNTMDLNNVSEEINMLIRTEILPPFNAKIKKGDRVNFTGCIAINQADFKIANIEIIPLLIQINPKKP